MTGPALDLMPAARAIAAVVAAIPESALGEATPSANYRLADLLDHVDGLSIGLQLTARKEPVPTEDLRDGDGALLTPGWRERIPAQLLALGQAWADPAAWEGDTVQGGVPVPAAASGRFVLNELLVHGWELARVTGQEYRPDPAAVDAVLTFLRGFPRNAVTDQVFGPVVAVPDAAPAFDHLLGLTGRDPGWSPAS